MGTRVHTKQLLSTNEYFLNLYEQVEALFGLNVDSLTEVNISYTYDSNGNVTKQVVTDLSATPIVLIQSDYSYDTDGNVTTEVVTRGNLKLQKTFGYDSLGNIVSISVRKTL